MAGEKRRPAIRKILFVVTVAMSASVASTNAQTYPSRPITIIVPYPVGAWDRRSANYAVHLQMILDTLINNSPHCLFA
jgi:tripartite-type tricarboxylate transporter receptor subunit TctC